MIFLTTFHESLRQAADYYNEIDRQVARRFIEAVDETTNQIEKFPKVGRVVRSYRMFPLKGFPFSMCYFTNDRGELVVLVLHHHKREEPQIRG